MTTSVGARTALGVLTGLIALVAMLRLVAGAFTGGLSGFGLVVTLVAMVPWTVYVAWRARRSGVSTRTAAIVLGLDAVGLALVFVLVVGPVLALALSFAAFVLIWLSDRPQREHSREERWVRVEELRRPAEDEPDAPDEREETGDRR